MNGLHDTSKLCQIKSKLLCPENKRNAPDIYTFQESRSTPEVTKLWNQLLPGSVAYSHGSNRSRGVLLGVHPSSIVSLQSSIHDEDGRFVVAECRVDEEFFTVTSVYLEPSLNATQLKDILTDVSRIIDHFGHNRVMWVGDFNIAIHPKEDSSALRQQFDLNAHRNVLWPFMDDHELTDIWRAMNPFRNRYTVHMHIQGKHMSHYLLISSVDVELNLWTHRRSMKTLRGCNFELSFI